MSQRLNPVFCAHENTTYGIYDPEVINDGF